MRQKRMNKDKIGPKTNKKLSESIQKKIKEADEFMAKVRTSPGNDKRFEWLDKALDLFKSSISEM